MTSVIKSMMLFLAASTLCAAMAGCSCNDCVTNTLNTTKREDGSFVGATPSPTELGLVQKACGC